MCYNKKIRLNQINARNTDYQMQFANRQFILFEFVHKSDKTLWKFHNFEKYFVKNIKNDTKKRIFITI